MREYINNSIFNDFSSESGASEANLSKKPTKQDLKDVRTILHDFGIRNYEFPEFRNRYHLQQWLRDRINEKMYEGEKRR